MGARDPGGEKRGDLARPLFLAVFSKGKEEKVSLSTLRFENVSFRRF